MPVGVISGMGTCIGEEEAGEMKPCLPGKAGSQEVDPGNDKVLEFLCKRLCLNVSHVGCV
jgi:hypothetical protein